MLGDPRVGEAATELAEGGIELGPYVLEGRIGEGGMGAVYRARDRRSHLPVAIKILKEQTPELVKRFLREARIAASLHHPNMVVVHDILEREGERPALVMELLEGESLAKHLARRTRLTVEEAAPIILAVAGAVQAVHARGVIHRDLKPDNVFLARQDGETVVKVLDFGIAKLTEADEPLPGTTGTLTRTGQILGTPQYMAPEVIFGEDDIDARADVWSLGVILYEALAGVRPFDGENSGQVFKAIALDPHVPLASRVPLVPPSIAALVERMLAHARAERLADLAEVIRVLEPFAPGGGTLPRAREPQRSRARGWLVLAAAAALGATGFAAWSLLAREPAVAPSSAVIAPNENVAPPTPTTTTTTTTTTSVAPPVSATPATSRPDEHQPRPRVVAPARIVTTTPSASASAAPTSSGPRHRSGGLRPDEL